jgi:4-hydroxy-tetrahydrodipicolinate reductase
MRRLPFQKKIGSGLAVKEFAERVKAGTVRHVGLAESVAMIADALGWKLDRVTDEIQPMIAKAPVESRFLRVETGQVCGINQEGVGYREGRPDIVLHMEAYLGAPETYDSVQIQGSPPLQVKASGGYHGDVATVSIAVNTIPRVLQAPPGLHTMRSLALPAFAGGK